MPHINELPRSAVESALVSNYPGLRLLLERRIGDPATAADLLNQAVCVSWNKWRCGQIENPEAIAGYVFQVALNLLRNHRRSMSERPDKRVEPERLETLAADCEPCESCSDSAIAVRLRSWIRGLGTPRDRAILTRFYLEEEESDSICRDMQLDLRQFHRVLHRARTRLRKLMEDDGVRECDV
jgi:RNA polymerase sigma-70 factor (ECF subfamily)